MNDTKLLALIAALVVGCSSSDGTPTTDSGISSDAPIGTGDPCSIDCDRAAAAACSKTPAGYAEECKMLCAASKKATKTECATAFDDIYRCANGKTTYSCSATGNPQVTPTGACAVEGAACSTCNDGKSCSFLL